MRIGALFAVFVYTILTIFVSIWLLAIGIGYVPEKVAHMWVSLLYTNPQYQLYLLIIGAALLIVSFIFFRISFAGPRKEKQVLFKGDSGEVIISLNSPIESIVKEVASQLKEVVDVKQDSYMWKKTLVIELRVVMLPGVKIKDISEKIQEMIIERIREVVGLDSPVKVKVKVVRLAPRRKELQPEEENIPIPFRNMDV